MEPILKSLASALIQTTFQPRINDILSFIKQPNHVVELLSNKNYPLPINLLRHEFIEALNGLDDKILISNATKVFWMIDTFQSLYIHDELGSDTYGYLLFKSLDVFDFTPSESLNINWTTIFIIATFDRICQLHYWLITATELEKARVGNIQMYCQKLHIDAIDCIAKATTFKKLVDDGWIKSYQAKLNRKKQVDRLMPLQNIVLTRYIKYHRNADIQSAANAIECELLEAKCLELNLLKSKQRFAKTFAEWLTKHQKGELKITVNFDPLAS